MTTYMYLRLAPQSNSKNDLRRRVSSDWTEEKERNLANLYSIKKQINKKGGYYTTAIS